MKVVLFCGGPGLRLPDHPLPIAKPMIQVGYRPILWHVMRYYAHFGHRDFVLCLGYRGDTIKSYFLDYDETLSNDFVLSDGGAKVDLLTSDIADWRITFADTGLRTNVARRLKAVRRFVDDQDIFLANYGDIVTDARLPDLVDDFMRRDKVAAFLSVRPTYSFHVVTNEPAGEVTALRNPTAADLWINGGYFMFRRSIFDYLDEAEDLLEEPFRRLVDEGQLITYRHDGFWTSLDTLRDLENLERLHDAGSPPWAVWQVPAVGTTGRGTR